MAEGEESDLSQGRTLKPGGPCCVCGATLSSTWYGRRGTAENPGKRYCRSNPCKLAGGYSVGKRRRSAASDVSSETSESVPPWVYKVSKIEACLGMRCAHPCFACPCFACLFRLILTLSAHAIQVLQ